VWVTEHEEAGGLLSEIVRCQRLLYELRSGRAVWLGQQADQEAAARLYEATPEGETLQLFEEPESGSPF
jgi:hypothetical protein